MKKIIAIAAAALITLSGFAQGKEYLASYFGIKSNGIIDNTTSIQKAIDYIAEHGGGTLTFSVGRYVTGAVYLKSNVNIRLDAAADIIGRGIARGRGLVAFPWPMRLAMWWISSLPESLSERLFRLLPDKN